MADRITYARAAVWFICFGWLDMWMEEVEMPI